MLQELKGKIMSAIPGLTKSGNTDNANRKVMLTEQQCPQFDIDSVTFCLNTLQTKKKSQQVRRSIEALFDDLYLMRLGVSKVTVETVGKKYFIFVKKTTQTTYNYNKSSQRQPKNREYRKLLKDIYEDQKMVRHLWSIDFTRLKVLNLSKHKLSSIEGIQFINAPRLQCLELHSNNLSNINSLSKIHAPRLRILTLYNNKIQEANKMNRCSSQKLNQYELDCQVVQNFKIEDISFLFKMKRLTGTNGRQTIQKIYMHDQNRVLQMKKITKFEMLVSDKKGLKLPPQFDETLIQNQYNHRLENMVYD